VPSPRRSNANLLRIPLFGLPYMRTSQRSPDVRLSALIFFAAALSVILVRQCVAFPDDSEQETTSLKQMTLEQLGSLQVTTTSKAPEAIWKTPAAVYVITREAIIRSGATTIPDALRLAPGVEVARIDTDKWSIGIRGFGSRLNRDVLVLIDGRTVYTTLLAGTYWEVQDTVLEDVDRIEVIRGPGATIWGPNAVNGVINIITKNASETQGTLVKAQGGNVEQGTVVVRQGGKHGALNYRVYGKAFNRGPQYHPDGRNFDDWQGLQGGFRMDWAKNTRDQFNLQGDIYGQSFGESVSAVSYTPPYSLIIDKDARLSGGNILGRWKRTMGEDTDMQLQVYYDRASRHEPNVADVRDTFDIDFLDRIRLFSRNEISWGFGARFSHGYNPVVVSGLTFQPPRRTDRLLSAFLQDDIDLVDQKLFLTVGTKILETNFSPVQLQPTARLMYTPTDHQTWWAAFTHAIRTPSDAERNFFLSGFSGIAPDGLPFFARFNGNPNFHSEQMNGYELGYRQLLHERLFIDVAGFYNHYGNLFSEDIIGPEFIETDPAPTHHLLPAEFGNGLVGTTTGGEIAPEWQVTDFWRLRGSYSFLEMHIKRGANSLDVGSAPSIEGSSPQHQVVLQSGFDLPKNISLDLIYRYESALPALGVRAYSTGDVSVGWKMSEHFRLSAVGQNLFQPHHPEFAGDPGPLVGIKRSAYGQILWQK
jgi:iron complex outermembrane recepter protein